jgi:hypothetical protein
MQMISPTVAVAILVALVGWFATIRVISASKFSSRLKQWLLIPSWIPWMAFALGAPILAGSLTVPNAINLGGAMTMGMVVSVVVSQRRPPKR